MLLAIPDCKFWHFPIAKLNFSLSILAPWKNAASIWALPAFAFGTPHPYFGSVKYGGKTKLILYTLCLSRKRFTCVFCHENVLRTSSGKFLRVESCHPESSDFLDLCAMQPDCPSGLSRSFANRKVVSVDQAYLLKKLRANKHIATRILSKTNHSKDLRLEPDWKDSRL